ncbi:MAG TPA: helix-turn-helix domain-containing protein [Magnetospirillum sp.]|jgi:AcrR family transcriptional regulator|nr:helix-turn-helix domain-containing protein [Magnetospirillum sp.]
MAEPGTHERIVAAASDLLAVRGVRALTLDGVASRAHLSKGALLYHFKSKDELIRAMLHHAIAECMAREEDPVNRSYAPNTRNDEIPLRSLVRALVAAACLSPPVLKENAARFADLARAIENDKRECVPECQAIACAVGAALLDEFGLGPLLAP